MINNDIMRLKIPYVIFGKTKINSIKRGDF